MWWVIFFLKKQNKQKTTNGHTHPKKNTFVSVQLHSAQLEKEKKKKEKKKFPCFSAYPAF